jgi:predicted dehydrogenase
MNLSHDIDAMRYICGEVRQISAHLSNRLRGDSAEDSGTVSMVLENGAVGTILYSDSIISPSVHNWLTICGTEGCIEIGSNLWSSYKPGTREIERTPIPVSNKVDSLTEQIKTFAGMIAGTAEPLSTVEDARKTTAVQIAILESDRKGKAVEL